MKNAIKKAISILLVAIMVFGAAPLAGFVGLELPEINLFNTKAEAEEAPTSGTCGENLTWTFDESTGELVITGTGDMTNWSYDLDVPWYTYRSYIKKVTISNGVKNIGHYAIFNCTNLESVIISNTVTNIDFFTFYGCTNLESILVDSGNTVYSSDEFGVLFNIDRTELIHYPIGNARTNYTIPDSVTNIVNMAFENAKNLTKIIIPNNLNRINPDVFRGCENLENIKIPDSVIIICDAAFDGCKSLENITIGDGVKSIGSYAFANCANLVTIIIPNKVISIGYGAFQCCEKLSNITLGNSLTYIDHSAFYKCKNLKSISIPNGVENIKDQTFYECTSLKNVIIPESVINIGELAFGSCDSLENISIPNSVISIGDGAFLGCKTLETIKIPDSVTSIGDNTFAWCTNLENIEISNNITSIGSSLFSGCKINNITIPDNITNICDSAFESCEKLESITLPKSVKKIEYCAFGFCNKIKDVYYAGSKAEWEQIIIEDMNEHLISAKIHYNSTGPVGDSTDAPDNTPNYDSSVVDPYLMPTPTESTISYGDSIVLHVDPSKIPEGGYVEWYPSNENFNYSVSADGTICTITPEKSGDTTFTAVVYDAEGNIVLTDEQTMTSKAGFFDKIIGFFKKLFGLTKIYDQE